MIRGGFFFNLDPKQVDPEFDNPEQCCLHEFSSVPCFRDECRNTDPDWYVEQDAIWAANENFEQVRTDHNMRQHADFYENLAFREIYWCGNATVEQHRFLLLQISSFDSMLVELLYGHNYLEAIKYLSRFATRAKVWLGRADGFWSEGRKTFYEGCVEVAHILLAKQRDALENLMDALEGTADWSKSHRIVNEWIENVPLATEKVDDWDSVGLRIQTQQEEQVEESACNGYEDEDENDEGKNKEDENYAKFKSDSDSESASNSEPESNSDFSKVNSI